MSGGVDIRITGGDELARRLGALPDAVRGRMLLDAVTSAGELIADRAKQLAPVRTGNLRRSLHVEEDEVTGDRASVKIGTNTEYAPFVEFGTRHQMAQPYLRPAFDEMQDAALREIKDALWDALRSA